VIALLLTTALAVEPPEEFLAPPTVRVPFPTKPMYDTRNRVCMRAPIGVDVQPTASDDGRFLATCQAEEGVLEICMTLLVPEMPERIAPLDCETPVGTLRVLAVPAFDPTESVFDGVRLARNVDSVQGTFQVDLPDQPGILDGGSCGVRDGHLWVLTTYPAKHQVCTLVDGETEQSIPITLVRRL
jgi:hypothetical protein